MKCTQHGMVLWGNTHEPMVHGCSCCSLNGSWEIYGNFIGKIRLNQHFPWKRCKLYLGPFSAHMLQQISWGSSTTQTSFTSTRLVLLGGGLRRNHRSCWKNTIRNTVDGCEIHRNPAPVENGGKHPIIIPWFLGFQHVSTIHSWWFIGFRWPILLVWGSSDLWPSNSSHAGWQIHAFLQPSSTIFNHLQPCSTPLEVRYTWWYHVL